jgi:hypothetical protein
VTIADSRVHGHERTVESRFGAVRVRRSRGWCQSDLIPISQDPGTTPTQSKTRPAQLIRNWGRFGTRGRVAQSRGSRRIIEDGFR